MAGTAGTAHPPLSVALAWWSQHVFGGSAFRWPAYLAGALLVPAAFAAGRALYGSRAGIVAAAVAAVGPAFVWASAAGGPTTITALLVCLAVVALIAALDAGGVLRWIPFGVLCAAVVWTHQFGIVTVAVLCGAAGFGVVRAFRSDRQGRRYGPPAGWGIALAMTLTAAALVVGWQDGLGAASTPPTLEYATNAAPASGTTPFGLAAGALSTIVGFHPPDVTSRLLALWPLGILGAFVLLGRRWSSRGMLLVGLAAAPFLALLIADLAGAPRQPPLALEWLAPALPAVALAIGRAVDRLTATHGRTGPVLLGVIAVLVLGTADQTVRVAGHPASPSAAAAGPSTTAPAPTTATPQGDEHRDHPAATRRQPPRPAGLAAHRPARMAGARRPDPRSGQRGPGRAVPRLAARSGQGGQRSALCAPRGGRGLQHAAGRRLLVDRLEAASPAGRRGR